MSSIIIGVILVIGAVFGITYWWWDVAVVFRGLLPLVMLILGAVAIFAGLEIMRENNSDDDAGGGSDA